MDKRIEELERKLETARLTYINVELEWDELLEKKLRKTGRVRFNPWKSKTPDYKMISQPVQVSGSHSLKVRSAGLFGHPCGIAIDPMTNDIYICDSGWNRVQVFTSSYKFLFLSNHKMNGPAAICICQDKVHVAQFRSCYINVYSTRGELLNSVGGKGNKELEFAYPLGIDVSID
ncbi:hypothetical protein LOD99_14413 [Oopsacas minuta]|uniref:Uncharacterized protein n=1 Tax=Oopsacas minuta TaxID=111878 RepID=A0AAV7KFP4_9METZ|nr:hypothetical protein LOD99_14413 [Oopsacas minuta]